MQSQAKDEKFIVLEKKSSNIFTRKHESSPR